MLEWCELGIPGGSLKRGIWGPLGQFLGDPIDCWNKRLDGINHISWIVRLVISILYLFLFFLAICWRKIFCPVEFPTFWILLTAFLGYPLSLVFFYKIDRSRSLDKNLIQFFMSILQLVLYNFLHHTRRHRLYNWFPFVLLNWISGFCYDQLKKFFM